MAFLLVPLVASALFYTDAFFVLTAALTAYVMVWSLNLSLSSCVGAWILRRETAKDWHGMLHELQEGCEIDQEASHIVILPNFKEDVEMLRETLENLARSPMAKEHVRVVLAMEVREGDEAERKAGELIKATSSLFADMFATFHPENLKGEVAGKSSNAQWALQEALRRFAPFLGKRDLSRVFLTVGDADTQWHPQYLSAVAAEGLQMSREKRVWTIWQPPVLLLRNLWTVPGVTRVSGYATLMFELAGLVNQVWGTHLCYSAYSLTAALAVHRLVRGWDADVIAEDHHMFCKCYFASIWEAVELADRHPEEALPPVAPKVQLHPVYLPAISYLVESTGYWASCYARFQQARRHSQGIAELSYVFLQYFTLLREAGPLRIPLLTHLKILGIPWKMLNVHVVNTVQAVALIIAGAMCAWMSVAWLADTGLQLLMASGPWAVVNAVREAALETLVGQMVLRGGPITNLFFFAASLSIFFVSCDTLEGRYNQLREKEPRMSGTAWCRLKLLVRIKFDMCALAEPTLMIYGLIPAVMAAWSLFWRGTKFEYIVAAKPEHHAALPAEDHAALLAEHKSDASWNGGEPDVDSFASFNDMG